MSDEKTPLEQAVEQAVDVFVYAPIGLLFEGPSLLPKLVEQGKNQVNMARMIGQFAVQQGQTEAQKQVSKLQEQAAGFLALLGNRNDQRTSPPGRAAARPGPAATSASTAPAASSSSASAGASAATDAGEVRAPRPSSGDSSGLAIPDYDSLSASQVVNRLAGLSTGELEAVRTYEAAHRGRKTILNKVAQLQG